MTGAPDPRALEHRAGLPERLRVLAEALPRSGWEANPNFDAMTRFWLDRHLMFRDATGQLLRDGRAFLEAPRDARRHARDTARLAGFLLNQLHGHHSIEDAHYFPALRALDPRLDDGFALLDGDHQALDGHIHGLAETVNAFLARHAEADARDRAADLAAALERFEHVLDRHLEDEEDLVVPVILTYAPAL